MRTAAAGIWALSTAVLAGQSRIPDLDPAMSFEVASVKPNSSGSNDSSLSPQRGGGFVVTNLTLGRLIAAAYQLQRYQLDGGPPWLNRDRFDIVARYRAGAPPLPPGGPTVWMFALRTLFADRFKLVVHWETRQLPVYALRMASADGKLGPAIHPAAVDCEARAAADAAVIRAGGPPPLPVNSEARMACGIRNTGNRILFGGSPLSLFVQGLSNQVQRPVIDRTGLMGNWDFELTFAPEQQRQTVPGDAGSIDPSGASIFTAMQEQLGLKLEATTGPIDVLVIDSVEPPTPD
jgi:uncharacterized protein (TIGR03435 family)